MAIVETVLGPNSTRLTYTANETAQSVLTAMDTYITAHGWELYDAAAPQGQTVGRVYRALQEGSTTMYKYVGLSIGVSTTSYLYLRIYENWNPVTHVGTNDGSFLGDRSNNLIYQNIQFNNDGASVLLFVHPRWLGVRPVLNTMAYNQLNIAVEIKKDFGEAENMPSNIFMSSGFGSNQPSQGSVAGVFGTVRNLKGTVGSSSCTANTVMTPYGSVGYVGGSYYVTFNHILPTTVENGMLTMTAAELKVSTGMEIEKLRGRIHGIKLIYGTQVWNDMDLSSAKVDSQMFLDPAGQDMSHHIISQTGNIRIAIPV